MNPVIILTGYLQIVTYMALLHALDEYDNGQSYWRSAAGYIVAQSLLCVVVFGIAP